MFGRPEHIGIMVKDMERSIAFYTDVLGLTLRERIQLRSTELAFFPVGDTDIELVSNPDEEFPRDGIVNHFCFAVDDIDVALAHLKKHRVELLTPEPREAFDGIRLAFFRGPDGEKFELFERSIPKPRTTTP